MMLNKIYLLGNLGKDAEMRQTHSGASYAHFTMATNDSYQDRDGNWQTSTEWHTVKVWNRSAARAAETLKKGHLVHVEGVLSSFESQSGSRLWEIKALNWRSCERKTADQLLPPEPPPASHVTHRQNEWTSNQLHNPAPWGEGNTRR